MELFVNNLTIIDFSFLDFTRGLVGESLIVDVCVQGKLDSHSMVMDFSLVKKVIREYLDATIDHALVVPLKNKNVSFVQHGSTGEATLYTDEGSMDCFISGPSESFYPIPAETIDKNALEKWLKTKISERLPDNVSGFTLMLREQHIAGNYYHYAHSLKKHAGNCQRIAHGHRSAIIIFVDGERSASWEMFWAERWRDCYLMSEEDVVDSEQLSARAQKLCNPKFIASAYTASKGRYEILLRHEHVEILPCDTTIERIAAYIKQEIGYLQPELKDVSVYAFEGIEKGAHV